MSVVKSKRNLSSAQFVYNSLLLSKDILLFSKKQPKRHFSTIVQPLCSHAIEVLYHCNAANRIYVSERVDYEMRRSHLIAALGDLVHVSTLLDLLYELVDEPNDNVYGGFYTLIDEEYSLIKGVMRKDRDVCRQKGIVQ